MPTNTQLESQLNTFKKDVENKFDAILNILEKPKAQFTPENAPVESRAFRVTKPEDVGKTIMSVDQASAEASNYTLNPAYQRIFEEYFDPADGFTGRLQGVYFTIVVPKKFSNADAAWKAYYKEDTRLKVIKHDRIEDDMRDWCKMVARNLKYDRNIRLKR